MKVQTTKLIPWARLVLLVGMLVCGRGLMAQVDWKTERQQKLDQILELIMQETYSREADSLLTDLESKAVVRGDSEVIINVYMIRINSHIDSERYIDSVLDRMKPLLAHGGPRAPIEYQIDRSYAASLRGDYQLQIYHLDSATKLAETAGDSTALYQTMVELSLAYQNVNNPEAALSIGLRASEYSHGNSSQLEEAYVMRNIGVCYEGLGQLDSAMAYTDRALEIYREIGNELEGWFTHALQGQFLFKDGDVGQGRQRLQQATDSLFEGESAEYSKNAFNQVLTWLAEARLASGDAEGAKEVARKGYEYAREANQSVEQLEALKVFLRASLASDPRTEEYFATFLRLQGKLHGEQNQRAVLEFERKYQTKEAEKKVLLLQQDAIAAEVKVQNIRFVVFLILALALVGGLVVGLLVLRTRIRTQAQIKDLNNKALQLQINPHFFFNVLNSIGNYITQNDARSAHLYLARFAKLMRLTLESSREDLVELGRETEFLKAYLELEQLRNDRFDFEVHCDESLQDTLIPPLMIQPFAENAVLHAFHGQPGYRGKLIIRATEQQGFLKVEIEDNGSGMPSGQNKPEPRGKKSLAISILEERLAKYGRKKGRIRFEVPHADDKSHPGTRVILEIPLNLAT